MAGPLHAKLPCQQLRLSCIALPAEEEGYSPFYSARAGPRQTPAPRAPEKQEVALKLALEDLYKGTTKKLRITRKLYDAASGKLVPVQEVCVCAAV